MSHVGLSEHDDTLLLWSVYNTEREREREATYTQSHLSAHVVNRLLRENRNSIPII